MALAFKAPKPVLDSTQPHIRQSSRKYAGYEFGGGEEERVANRIQCGNEEWVEQYLLLR